MPVIELTTIGRKSGLSRSVLLTVPWQQGEQMALIASAGGNDQHPAWLLNLRDEPLVTVRTADGTKQMTARITSGSERDEIWRAAVSEFKHYASYESKADREIPIVVLEPLATPS